MCCVCVVMILMYVCDVCGGSGKVCVLEECILFFEGCNGLLVFWEYELCDDCGGMGWIVVLFVLDVKGWYICFDCFGFGKW